MNLSTCIITRNEEKMVADCLKSVSFADEVVVIDSQSRDKTVETAKNLGAKVFVHKFKNFADQRNYGLSKVKGKWVLYVDADERVTKELKSEILAVIKQQKTDNKKQITAYRIPRKNYYFGNYQWPMIEKLERLFWKNSLKGWRGAVHESPEVKGEVGELRHYLLHHTHRSLESMVEKTNDWSEIEAEILYKVNHPRMTWWRFLRVMLVKFWNSYVGQRGWKVGTVGFLESAYQAYSYFIIYAKLWEKQQRELKT